MSVAWVLAAALLIPQEATEAEEALRKADKALAKVGPGVDITFEEKFDEFQTYNNDTAARRTTGFHAGNLELRGGNRLTLKLNLRAGDSWKWREILIERTETVELRAEDGRTSRIIRPFPQPPIEFLAREGLTSEFRRRFLRLGAQTAAAQTVEGMKPAAEGADPAQAPEIGISNLKLLGAEKLDDRETIKLRYTLEAGARFGKPVVTIWLDAKTFLPIQRQERIDLLSRQSTHVEKYSINGTRDPVEP